MQRFQLSQGQKQFLQDALPAFLLVLVLAVIGGLIKQSVTAGVLFFFMLSVAGVIVLWSMEQWRS